ncbi:MULTISPECIES: zf-TFIIB domain-containing protein [Gordonibacter]|uniref:Zf-TFIIB domain-containing protein n=1 Tax=Gordonibacter faecis TaxID=3047475 RepID=A0ABT7DKD3_9ACTN|nr:MULTISPECIES: zf-TFIIB domain-containing protein [unclassified Gordonibacter]MDJ1649991.1 zf-TFIIB domain-containing protein [Gordonibacter sp. KGMB12511]HIW76689.1 zf-TFIIB domain-containing protein [Candidatus Gordonibacter avicola]
MKCPLCNVDLVMSERQGIEIDYCPQCRGVWLDRGELDKIIERANAAAAPAAAAPAAAAYAAPQAASYERERERGYDERRYDDRGYDKRYDKYDDDHYKKGHKKKKRGDFLSDLFEFGD